MLKVLESHKAKALRHIQTGHECISDAKKLIEECENKIDFFERFLVWVETEIKDEEIRLSKC